MPSRSGNKMAKLKTGIDGFGNLTVAGPSRAQGAFSMDSLGARYKGIKLLGKQPGMREQWESLALKTSRNC
jgi:hypothetical protein